MDSEFPGNAHKNKPQKKEPIPEKKIEKVALTGEVVHRKKSLGAKIRDYFVSGDFKAVAKYVAVDVLVPAFRNTIYDASTKGIERVIYGDAPPPNRPMGMDPRRGRPTIQYNSPVDRYSTSQRGFLPGQSSHMRHNRHDINDIILASREDAESVIESLVTVIEQWEVVSVMDLKEMLEIPSTFVDNNWGWYNLSQIDVRRVRDGYLLVMPPAEPI